MKQILVWVLLLMLPCPGQVVLTEVMFDPIGSEHSDEFVELYNAGTVVVNLSGWQICDGSSCDEIIAPNGGAVSLLPGQYAVILDPNYFSDSSDAYLMPPQALVATIAGATFGTNGFSNSVGEAVILRTADGDTAQHYLYTPDNAPGFSDEKRDPGGGNASANWGNSRWLNGTPGRRNSLTPADIDLEIRRFTIPAAGLQTGVPVIFHLVVKNIGRRPLNGFTLQKFYDENGNLWADPGEIIETGEVPTELAPGDSLAVEDRFENPPYGPLRPGVYLSVPGDGDTLNNVATHPVFVDDPARVGIIINEIMFEPASGLGEWVELYNRGSTEVNLRNVLFADARDTLLISATDRWLPSGAFVVLGKDSAIAGQYGIPPDQLVIAGKFPTLNNDFDDLQLLGPSLVRYERVNYTGDWYGRKVERGISLEKINPEFNGQMPGNWAAAVATSGSTPGKPNSVLVQPGVSSADLDISPNPFSPDGDGHEDFAVIRFQLDTNILFVNVRIFDIRGRLVRFLANGMAVAGRGQLVWDGKDDNGRVARIGAYICYLQALDTERQTTRQFKKTIILMKQ